VLCRGRGVNQFAPSNQSMENETCELNQPIWAVVSAEGVIRQGVTYAAAIGHIDYLISNSKFAGLCIVTAEAANRTKFLL
jgi:hypothetical protein